MLNDDLGYVGQVERFHIFPYVETALRLFTDKGFSLFIVTNQSGIERGYFTWEDVHRLHSILEERLRSHGVKLKEIFVSPHRPETPNDIRKPSPKFIFEAAKKYEIDLSASYVIGDQPCDLEMGYRAGCKVVLVRSGAGSKTEKKPGIKFDFIFDNLLEAAKALK